MKIIVLALLVATSLSTNKARAEWVKLDELPTVNASIERESIQVKKGIVRFRMLILEPDKNRFPSVAKVVDTMEINCEARLIRGIDEVQYDVKGKTSKGQGSAWQKIVNGTAIEAVHYRVCP